MTINIDKWDDQLNMADSQHRAGVLVDIVEGVDPDVGRELLAHWWNLCDATRPWHARLVAQFERCRPVTDDPVGMRKRLRLPVIVYRGAWSDDDAASAISWTLDRETAEQFCRIISGPRGWFLGMNRDDVEPHVFRAVCRDAYGFINGRDEAEVLAAHVEQVEAISALRTVTG